MAYVTLLETWCNLFSSPTSECIEEHFQHHTTQENDDDSYESKGEEVLDFELEQIIVMQIFERVIKYFARVHLSDISSKFLDEQMGKKKKFFTQDAS